VVRNNYPCAPNVDSAFCVCDRHNALETELAIPSLDHLCNVCPTHRRIEHFREISPDGYRTAIHVDVIVKLRELEALVGEIIDAPHRFDRELKRTSIGEPERN